MSRNQAGRKLFVCRDCEGVYADQPVSRCDCMGREIYDEYVIASIGIDWREHSKQYARGEKCPDTLETAQAAWARDQEVIFDQKAEIAKLKEKVNQLQQKVRA